MTDNAKIKEITLESVDELAPNPRNPNAHSPEQIDRLAELIQYQGFRLPIVVSKRSGQIVAGHGRLMAAKKLGLTRVPVTHQDFESDEQEYAFMVSDNSIADWAILDLKAVNLALPELGPDFNIDMLGIKDFVIEPLEKLQPGADEDDVPSAPAEATTKPGDVYQLGRHRLMCGDSTNVQHVDELMGGEKAHMVFTDPPYGISFDDRANASKQRAHTGRVSQKFGKIAGDDEEFDPSFLLGYFDECPAVFLWGANEYASKLPRGAWIVWDKKLEQQADCPHGDFELCWSKGSGWKMLRHVWGGFQNRERNEEKRFHPTQKPVALAEDFFDRWGKVDDLVVDLYGGSGSTLIACEKTNRRCFMMELDPKYCDVIVERWEKYTGKKAELLERAEVTHE